MPEPVVGLDEIRGLMAHLPGPDLEAGTARGNPRAAADENRPERWAGSRNWRPGSPPGRVRHPPTLAQPRTVRLCSYIHGVAARGVSAYPAAVTGQMVQEFSSPGGAAVNQLCKLIDADLRVYE